MLMRRFWKSTGIGVVLVGLGGVAQAAPPKDVRMTFETVTPGADVNVGGTIFSGTTRAGEFKWNYVNSPNGLFPSNPFKVDGNGKVTTFCIELTEHIGYNTTYDYDVAPLNLAPDLGAGVTPPDSGPGMGVIRANAIKELWGLHFGKIGSDNDKAASFQLAVWEIVYDFDGSYLDKGSTSAWFGVGKVQSSASQATLAATWLDSLTGLVNSTYANLVSITSGDPAIQDQVVELRSGNTTAVPMVPASLGGVALLGMIAIGRRRGRE